MLAFASNVNQKKKILIRSVQHKNFLLLALLSLVIISLDQITKIWAVSNLTDKSIQLLGDFIRFTLVYNKGGAMGTSFGSPTLYLILALTILPLLIYYIFQYRNFYHFSIPLTLIASGAVGNLADRIRLGQVVDFIDVDFFDINLFGFQLERWWTFNIADAAISCAIVYLLIQIIFSGKIRNDPSKESDSPANFN